ASLVRWLAARAISGHFRPAPRTCQYLPGQPWRAVSWHIGFRGGAHARRKTARVDSPARRRGGVAGGRAYAAASEAAVHWLFGPQHAFARQPTRLIADSAVKPVPPVSGSAPGQGAGSARASASSPCRSIRPIVHGW